MIQAGIVAFLLVGVFAGDAGAVSLNLNSRGHCEQVAGDSYALLKTCLDMEKGAQDGLSRRSVEGRIISHCGPVAGNSYALFETCVDMEEKARNKMRGRGVEPRIKRHCDSVAGDSYSLFETCVGMEERARRELGR